MEALFSVLVVIGVIVILQQISSWLKPKRIEGLNGENAEPLSDEQLQDVVALLNEVKEAGGSKSEFQKRLDEKGINRKIGFKVWAELVKMRAKDELNVDGVKNLLN